jgi:hypothetical protein
MVRRLALIEYIGIAIVIVVSSAILLPQAWRSLRGRDPFGGPLSEGWSPRIEAEEMFLRGYRRGREDGYAEGWRESQKEAR